MVACLLGICAAGSIPLAANPDAVAQPIEVASDLVGAESAYPQIGFGNSLLGFGNYGGYGGYGGKSVPQYTNTIKYIVV